MRKAGNRFARVTAVLALIALVGAAAFGVYRIAGTALDRMFPPAASGVSPPPASSRASAPPARESGTSAPAGAGKGVKAYSAAGAGDSGGVLGPYLGAAREKLSGMTLGQKVGQVFMFECPSAGAIKAIDDYSPGGYCLMGKDFAGKTAAQVKKTLASYQNSSKIPMLLACDEEGGTVVRVSSNPALAAKKFASPRQVFAAGGLAAVTADTEKKAALLKSLGVNVNLAPVCDISTDPENFMYDRSLGQDPETTAKFAAASVKAYEEKKVGSVLKHFPGYGSTKDTHEGPARDTRSYQSFQKADFLPFQAGMEAGAACVMISHNTVESMDAERPASLSPQVHAILREKLGFTGVVMTDSLSMGAVTQYMGKQNPAVEAFLAGNDVLLTSDIAGSYNALYHAVETGAVTQKRLEESVARILAWKIELGLLH